MSDGGGAGASYPMAIAHRGDPVAHRENTLPAVRAAVEAGADLVEIDVKTTSDGVSVVLHDDSLQRLWEVDRDVRSMTAAEVAAVGSAGTDGSGIPRLDAVLRVVQGTSTGLLVDLDSAEWAEAALAAVGRARERGEVRADQVVWCGAAEALETVRKSDPHARIFLSWGTELTDGWPSDELLDRVRPEAFNPYYQAVYHGARDWATEHGLALCCWTVDEEKDMVRLLDLGADAIISNKIDRLIGVRERLRGGAGSAGG